VALNDESANWLRLNTSSKTIVTIPNSIVWPIEKTNPRVDTLILKENKKYFLSVGRLNKHKAFDRLIRSYHRISQRCPDWDLVIVGHGEELGKLHELVEKFNLGSRVIFPGQVGNVGDWYTECDVFVLSSDLEGFPVSLLEAMASATAVISVDCKTGPRDIIENKVNGLLCMQTDIDLSECMLELAKNHTLRKTRKK